MACIYQVKLTTDFVVSIIGLHKCHLELHVVLLFACLVDIIELLRNIGFYIVATAIVCMIVPVASVLHNMTTDN
jgi:hypothetical protein